MSAPDSPDSLAIKLDAIPDALRERDKWICWRYEQRDSKQTKVPVDPDNGRKIDATDPINWNPLTDAQTGTGRSEIDGIGYVFNSEGPITGVDLDNCRVPSTGTILDYAQEIINEMDSFTEISPSGTGVHVYVKGDLPDGKKRNGDVEIYDGKRFFTVTGDHLEGTPRSVKTRQVALQSVHQEYVDPTVATEHSANTSLDHRGESHNVEYSHRELVEKAKNANGTGKKFTRLWNGDFSHQPSHSEGRLELYDYLAFWTAKDHCEMWKLFQESDLYPHPDPEKRGKCERLKDVEIKKAIQDTRNSYDPTYYDTATKTTQPSPAQQNAD